MTALKVKVKYDERTIQYRIQKGRSDLYEIHRSVMQAIGRAYRQYARDISPVKSGSFAKRWFFRTSESQGGRFVDLTLLNDDPKAKFVINPTVPHLIVPRNTRALRWTQDGELAFAKAVMHPGTKGNDVFTKVSDSAELEAESAIIVNNALQRLAEKL